MAFGIGALAAEFRAHLNECGRRYDLSSDAIRETKTELKEEINRLRQDQVAMDERNRKAISGVFRLLVSVAGGVAMVFATALGILLKAQLHIPG